MRINFFVELLAGYTKLRKNSENKEWKTVLTKILSFPIIEFIYLEGIPM